MLRLSKKADYALMAVRHLALQTEPSPTSARELAEQYNIPVELMAKVLQKLVRAGLLVSRQGAHGGYTLSRPSESISVADVIQVIDGPFALTACSSDNSHCDQYSKCSIRDSVWHIRERIASMLNTVTIAEIAVGSDVAQKPTVYATVMHR